MGKVFMYHLNYKKGKIFEEEEVKDLDSDWVDTPAKLPSNTIASLEESPDWIAANKLLSSEKGLDVESLLQELNLKSNVINRQLGNRILKHVLAKYKEKIREEDGRYYFKSNDLDIQ